MMKMPDGKVRGAAKENPGTISVDAQVNILIIWICLLAAAHHFPYLGAAPGSFTVRADVGWRGWCTDMGLRIVRLTAEARQEEEEVAGEIAAPSISTQPTSSLHTL